MRGCGSGQNKENYKTIDHIGEKYYSLLYLNFGKSVASTTDLTHASQNFSSLWLGHPLVWGGGGRLLPNTTSHTPPMLSFLPLTTLELCRRPEVSLLESENKFRLPGSSLSSCTLPIRFVKNLTFLGVVLPGVSPELP